jgi:hypothetical protein
LLPGIGSLFSFDTIIYVGIRTVCWYRKPASPNTVLKENHSGLFGLERVDMPFFLEIVNIIDGHEDPGFFNIAEAGIERGAKT